MRRRSRCRRRRRLPPPHRAPTRGLTLQLMRVRGWHGTADMERLSGLDASFLYTESDTVPLNVCSVVELDTSTIPGGYDFDRFRDDLALRIKAMPEFRAKLADSQLNLDHPVWVEDRDFDLSHHLQRISLPSPGGRTELADACGLI